MRYPYQRSDRATTSHLHLILARLIAFPLQLLACRLQVPSRVDDCWVNQRNISVTLHDLLLGPHSFLYVVLSASCHC